MADFTTELARIAASYSRPCPHTAPAVRVVRHHHVVHVIHAPASVRVVARCWTSEERPAVKVPPPVIKWRGHLVCIVVGSAVIIGVSYFTSGLPVHLAGGIGGGVILTLQEVWDRIFSL